MKIDLDEYRAYQNKGNIKGYIDYMKPENGYLLDAFIKDVVRYDGWNLTVTLTYLPDIYGWRVDRKMKKVADDIKTINTLMNRRVYKNAAKHYQKRMPFIAAIHKPTHAIHIHCMMAAPINTYYGCDSSPINQLYDFGAEYVDLFRKKIKYASKYNGVELVDESKEWNGLTGSGGFAGYMGREMLTSRGLDTIDYYSLYVPQPGKE